MKKTIHFIRHGQTRYNLEKKIQGSVDIPLSDIGIKQAEDFDIKTCLPKYDIAYHSSLCRSKKTLEIILGKLENPPNKIIMSDLIKERSYGIFEGLHETEIESKYPETFYKWKLDENTNILDADPIEIVITRLLDFVDMIAKSDDTNIIAVTHSGVLYSLYKYITDLDLGVRPKELYFHNCCSVYLNIYINENKKVEKYEFKFGDKINLEFKIGD